MDLCWQSNVSAFQAVHERSCTALCDFMDRDKREVYSNTTYLKKQDKQQINNLTLQLKQLEKKNRQIKKKKLVEGKK